MFGQGGALALMKYDWPGNIRELQNVIERNVIMSSGGMLRRFTAELSCPAVQPASRGTLMDAERAHILAARAVSPYSV